MEIEFEKLLLSALIKDEQFLKETMGYIDEKSFKNQYYRYFFTIINHYYEKYHTNIPFDVFKFLLQKTISTQRFSEDELPVISQLIIEIFNSKFNLKFLRTELGNQIKKHHLKRIINEAQKNPDINNIEKLLENITNVNKYDPEESKPLEYTSSLHKRSVRKEPIKTHIATLDTQIMGGIAPGEFGLISAQTGGCKSTFLLNFAWAAVMQDKKVLFITLEDSIDTVMMRFDSLFSSREFVEFRRDPKKSLELKDKVERHKNLLYVKDFSSGICTVGKIRSILSYMSDVDLIIVDYLDELGGAKRNDRWQEVEDASRQLKALAHDLMIPIWTATQTSSAAYGKEFVGLQHIYGGKGKAHISHIVLSIAQTEEERESNKLRIQVSKQKSGPKGAIIDCIIDLAKVRIYDATQK